jgi:hypothetical protein
VEGRRILSHLATSRFLSYRDFGTVTGTARRVCLLRCSVVRLRVRSAKYFVHSTIVDEIIVGLGGGE